MSISRRAWLLGATGIGGVAWLVWRRPWLADRQGVLKRTGELSIDGKPADVGALVRPGARVRVSSDGSAVLVIGEDAFLLDGGTEMVFPRDESNSVVRVLTVLTGAVLSVFGPKPITLETPTATIGIRGTGAYIEIHPDRTYACICYGSAEIRAKSDPGIRETIATKHHDQPRLIHAATTGRVIEPAPMINHTDLELIMLEALVDREPPFGTEPQDY